MSTTIYGVYESGGRYEDAFHNLIKAFSTKNAADALVKSLTERHEKALSADTLVSQHRTVWNEQNPADFEYPVQNNWPRWNGLRNSEITQAMRDERAAIQADNVRRTEEYNILHDQREQQWKAACKGYLVSAGVDIDIADYVLENRWFEKDVRFEVEEIEFD